VDVFTEAMTSLIDTGIASSSAARRIASVIVIVPLIFYLRCFIGNIVDIHPPIKYYAVPPGDITAVVQLPDGAA